MGASEGIGSAGGRVARIGPTTSTIRRGPASSRRFAPLPGRCAPGKRGEPAARRRRLIVEVGPKRATRPPAEPISDAPTPPLWAERAGPLRVLIAGGVGASEIGSAGGRVARLGPTSTIRCGPKRATRPGRADLRRPQPARDEHPQRPRVAHRGGVGASEIGSAGGCVARLGPTSTIRRGPATSLFRRPHPALMSDARPLRVLIAARRNRRPPLSGDCSGRGDRREAGSAIFVIKSGAWRPSWSPRPGSRSSWCG